MGRKNKRESKRENKREPRRYAEEVEESKGFSAFEGSPTPEWWHEADGFQMSYAGAIKYYDFITVDAKAGTGKTTIAVKEGLEAIKEGRADILRYVRFVDQRTQKLGFMKGDEDTKEKGFMYPFFEALEECGLQPEAIAELIAAGVIEMSTDIHLRGRNMKRTFLIVDECQNGDIADMRLVFTRVHDTGKIVAIGHSLQVDRKLPKIAGLIPFQIYQRHMNKKSWAKVCELQTDYRGRISQWADEIDLTIKELENSVIDKN